MNELSKDIENFETLLESTDEEIRKTDEEIRKQAERMKRLESVRATFVKCIDELRKREDCCKEAARKHE